MLEPDHSWRSRRTTFGVLSAFAVLVSFFWVTRLLLPGTHRGFSSIDDYLLYLPAYEVAAGWIKRGVLPLWNPYALCGIPWVAGLQEGFFYPPHVLYLLLPTPTAFAASTLLHLVFLAVSTVLFARRAGLGVAAAVLAAGLFVLRGTIPDFAAAEPSQFEALTWLPLGSVAVLDLARGGGRRSVALLALAAAFSFLAGYPQISVYVIYTWTTLFIALLLGARPGLRGGAAAAGCFAAALALGALGGGVQLLPGMELLHLGTRTSEPLSFDTMFPVGGPILGNPVRASLDDAISGSRFSFGVVGLALAVAAPFAARRRPLALWALGWCALTLVFALGPLTPLFPVYLALPTLAWFRAPNRIVCLTEFAFATAAAVGLDAVMTALGSRVGTTPAARIRVPWALLAALLGLVATSALVLAGVGSSSGIWPAALLAAGGTAALAALAWSRPERRPAFVGVLVALAIGEVFLTPPLDEILPYTSTAAAIYRRHEPAFALLGKMAGPFRVWIFNVSNPELTQKRGALYGLRSFEDYEPVNPKRHSQYYTYFIDGKTTVSHWPWLFAGNITKLRAHGASPPPATRRRLLDLAAVGFMVVPRIALRDAHVRDFVTAAGMREFWPLPGERPTPSAQELALFMNPHVLPRAYVVYRTRVAPPAAELLEKISRDDFDPLSESYVEGDVGIPPAFPGPARGVPARIMVDQERTVEVRATAAAPGLLVLADSFYPGWQATVDGVPAPILPTNHLFRGVPIPAGSHLVRFEYRPWSFRLGAIASLGSLGVVVLLLWTGRTMHEPRVGILRAA